MTIWPSPEDKKRFRIFAGFDTPATKKGSHHKFKYSIGVDF